ncbi:MAG TPA: signal recognition particle protein [Phycisphaerales bacterium]|nr:signal recognition particle protein [Phycisphaerales bacterium]HMP36655.1 signal recognition particle protein [Phycisphaerales bacterium]
MFETLTEKFNDLFRSLSGKGSISEGNVRDAMAQVRTALLEADVNQEVVKRFCDEVLQDALGHEVTKSLRPGEEMIGIVHRRLVELMAPPEGATGGILLVDPPPTVIMLCGLQGSGKTTTCGKLAAYLKKRGVGALVCAADLQRPAAVEQLRQVIEGVGAEAPGPGRVGFYAEPERCAEYGKAVGVAVGVCQRALREARSGGWQVLILDTAGRLHIDDALMTELQAVDRALQPHQILLVVDAMTGQDAVASARAFHARLAVDGVILTKFDSDTRGGAALSVRQVTGAPIKFIGTGEKFDALEEFHAERVAGRVLGMGDVVSLVERAQAEVSEAEAERIAEKMAKGRLTMEDFIGQLRSIRKMGPIKQLLGLLPGVGAMLKGVEIDERQLDRLEGMVNGMTRAERDDAALINRSRARRIASGSGVEVAEVTKLTQQFEAMNRVTKQLSGLGPMGRMKAMKELQSMDPAMMPGLEGVPGLGSRRSTATESIKSRFKKRKR